MDRRTILRVAVAYALMALAWSLLAFLTPERPTVIAEYHPGFLFFEIGGHLMFGMLVGAMTGDASLVILAGAFATLIDADHLMSIFFLPVLDRTAHSVFFAVLASLSFGYATRGERRFNVRIAGLVVGAILAHLSYDTLLFNGNFPLLAPFSFQIYSFPQWFWLVFECMGVSVVLLASWLAPRRPAGGEVGAPKPTTLRLMVHRHSERLRMARPSSAELSQESRTPGIPAST